MHKSITTALFVVPLALAACSDDAPPSTDGQGADPGTVRAG